MPTNPYKTPTLVSQYLLFHYGTVEQQLSVVPGPKEATDFPKRCVRECLDLSEGRPRGRALDLGCAVGRSSFELSPYFEEVLAADLSSAFIQAAQKMQTVRKFTVTIPVEGTLTREVELSLSRELPIGRVQFFVADALHLPESLGMFDAVLAANLIDRVPDPSALLAKLAGLVNPAGQLILTSPYTWLEEYTPRELWPKIPTFEFIREHLYPEFTLVRRQNLPFLIREHDRKFQWSVAEATTWRREEIK